MLKNYNVDRKKVRLPEYGRHIQDMVEYLMTIEDREVRNRQARVVVGVMGNVNPALRDSVDFNRKLWALSRPFFPSMGSWLQRHFGKGLCWGSHCFINRS